ncbi:ABC transporter substrate-binding protein [Brucella sp. NM4]|uniref:ABC transporter substrate-binding protein n=1 Tax=Brucella/Ochrobactrum group TaxID=2826938 RepID=UPI0024BCC197|nr:ABC transporter substrate-binding protein [Brucella sp. NM4]WHS29882.1 ABC transporter substrate-binding protein [Brucella sp. NM4]WHT44631.1 ABC transporter substrate-binding protein [Ochrobactrum sp. SSR]
MNKRRLPFMSSVCALTLMASGQAFAQDAASLVPQEIRDRGVLTVGSQQTFPPIEFREPGSQEVSGASADLLREIAKRLNLKMQFVQAEYSALIPGIEAKRFDMASGGISDTEEREQKLDFVNYMMSGGSMLVRAEDDSKYKTIADFCGKKVATLLGSRVIMAKVEESSATCRKNGAAAIVAEQLPSAPDARMQLDLKRVDAYLGDFPALVYMGSQFPGKYAIAGGNYILTPYITSWGFAKNQSGLRDAIKKATEEMRADGAYQSIMDKWGVGGGVLPEITINLPASKRN